MQAVLPRKSLGQNFLQDEKALQQIVGAAELSFTDNVFEIGPGMGALTKKLLEKESKVIAIEKDEKLAALLNSKFLPRRQTGEIRNSKLNILSGDILEINLPELIEQQNFIPYKVVANIPYYITGQIIKLFFETVYRPAMMVLLVQKEVAERICAPAGRMSVLSVSVQVDAVATIIGVVPRTSFYPVPQVDSAIIKIVMNPASPLIDRQQRKHFFQLVKIGFSSRRKTLANNLSAGLKREKKEMEAMLTNAGLEKNIRAQELTIEQWLKLIFML